MKQALLEKIQDRSAKIGIIGLGYVGLPLAVEFAEAEFSVLGVDLDNSKVEMLNTGSSYIDDIPSRRLKHIIDTGHLIASTNYL